MVGQKVVGHSLGPHVLWAGAVIHDDAVVDVDGSADEGFLDGEDSGDLADIDTESEEDNDEVNAEEQEAPALVEEEFGSSSYP